MFGGDRGFLTDADAEEVSKFSLVAAGHIPVPGYVPAPGIEAENVLAPATEGARGFTELIGFRCARNGNEACVECLLLVLARSVEQFEVFELVFI